MPIMADILLFPAKRALPAAYQYDASQTQAEALVASLDADAWPGDDTGDNGGLATVASLAAAPSQSLAGLVSKVEVLVARLAPDDGTDTGLCLAEASLLQSVLCDLRAFVIDAVFTAQGADRWAPVSTVANLMQGTDAS
jgi:hypothetical protein